MSDPLQGLGRLVPGFDFLQGLVKTAGSALPNFGQWVAPTLDPEELERRIEELRTVQFWLEQNARMLGATLQALEVQRMTLSTLKTMNVPVEALREALTLRMPATAAEGAEPPVDPMQWWGALTRQFATLAATAMTDAASESARDPAGSPVQPSFTAAEDTPRKGATTAGKAARAGKAALKAAAPQPAAPGRPRRTAGTRQG